jgi:hypothetical protein
MATTPEGFVIERCRTETCNAEIVWARTKTGKLMPVDAEPSGDGNVELFAMQGNVWGRVITAELIDALPGQYPRLRTSHFVTCQRPADWRKPR